MRSPRAVRSISSPIFDAHRSPRAKANLLALVAVIALAVPAIFASPQNASKPPELSRPVRPWEFISAVGMRAGLFGHESGRFESWVYPLKILRDFHLRFYMDGRGIPAESLARTVIVRPESTTIVYSGDTFSVRESLFTPVHESGSVILLDVDTEQLLEIEAAFHRDFQLEWPAGLGGTYLKWDPLSHAFILGEEQKKYFALVGSPTAAEPQPEYETNYFSSDEDSFRLGATSKGKETKIVVIAASVQSSADALATYQHLSRDSAALLRDSAEYYRNYLSQTVNLELPDAQLQQAYDWSRISMAQGIVTSPYLGTGLVAGYRTSGEGQRPGFAWYFGRDALWTSFALDSEGDFATTRMALDFLSKYQRADGKIPHEVAQGAAFVPWFTDYVYAYASADATPLYIIAMNSYVTQSGDVAFAKEKWDSLWKAYEFLHSTFDEQGFAKNFGVGHGWVEGGPLLPVKTELYQSAAGVEALGALANLARLTGMSDESKDLAQAYDKQKPLLNSTFWSADKNIYAFALDRDNKRVDVASVLSTVPMWFGLLDNDKSAKMIAQLADADHATDWGMRIISSRGLKYSSGGYHFGSVWPLFTGWASVGEYRYHRVFPAYENLRANALLALDGSLGHVVEVLSGDNYGSLSTASPQQIWSAAMVVSPMLRGMLGLEANATNHSLTFAPHVPADWTSFAVHNVHVGSVTLDLRYRKTPDDITLEFERSGAGDCVIEFSPALSLRAEVLGVEINGRPVAYKVQPSDVDEHVAIRFPVYGGPGTLRIRTRNDFGLSVPSSLPPLGSSSRGLRVLSETWTASRDAASFEIAGLAGSEYALEVWNPAEIESIDGAKLEKSEDGGARVRLQFSANSDDAEPYARTTITFHFVPRGGVTNHRKPKKL
ncbi:MAG: hypothetical protein WA755_01160 [Candidatus Acidiferrales bacterium]